MQRKILADSDIEYLLIRDEDHFFDRKSLNASGKTVQKIAVAFANADGGEFVIGIADTEEEVIAENRWNGADKIEDFNSHLQALTEIKPSAPTEFTILEAPGKSGLVLLVRIEKSSEVHQTADGTVYIRKGQVESIRFIGYDVPSDIAEALKSHNKQFDGHVELVIMARRGSFLPVKDRIRRFFNKEVELNKFIALKETKFKYQDVKLKTKVGHSKRTVSLGSLKLLRSYYDISDDVKMDGATGHPTFDSIDALAKDLASRIRKSMGIPDGEE